MGIKGAIFDMDGTLVDSMHVWVNLGSLYIKSKGYEPEEGLDDKLWTMTMMESAAYMKEQYGLEGEVKEIMAEVYRLVETFYRNEVQEKANVRRVLEDLWQAGIPMCVASATDSYLVEYALEHAGIRQYFQQIFCCRQVGEGKHSDKIYQVARESLGTKPEETWVFEDALHAAETAKKAGFPLVAVWDASEKNQERMKELGDIYLKDYREWPGIK